MDEKYDYTLFRRLRRIKEKIIGPMPKTQSQFDPGRSEEMTDGSKLQWADKLYNNNNGEEKRTLVFSTTYLLHILTNCAKLSCDGTFSVMAR